jgi:hypothetical protein
MSSETITVSGTEFYVDDIVEVIMEKMLPDAEENEDGTIRITLTEKDIFDNALDYANDHPEDTYRGSAFARLGFGYEVDRSVGFVELFDAPNELAGIYEVETEWNPYEGDHITALRKVK